MSAGWVVAIVLAIGAVAFFFAARRARLQASNRNRDLVPHSLPAYHGWLAFIFAVIPSLLFLLVWSVVSTSLVEGRVHAEVATHISDPAAASLSVGMVHNVADAMAQLGFRGANLPASYAEL